MTANGHCPSCGGEYVQDLLRPRFLVCGTCGHAELLKPPVLEPGTQIGQFQIREKLAEGGMSTLFLCNSSKTPDELRVLKVMPLARNTDYPLGKEAELLSRIRQENIVPFSGYWHDEFNEYAVMEYVSGKNLEQIVEENYRISTMESLRLMQVIANALNEVWKQGKILHRDLKPSNIMLDDDGFVRILDFGIASSNGKSCSAWLGTPGFMSPEQLRHREDGSCASDIYSLGATLYYVHTGHAPYDGDTPMEILDRMLHEEPVPVRDYVPELPEDYASFLMRMLAKKTAERPCSWDALLDEISMLLQAEYPAEPTFRCKKQSGT